jgi:DNA-binding winged helix-turn-helix (wHTH) protein
MERPGQLVTKRELLDAIWPETFVSETVLTNAINQLRRALDDDPKQARLIETVHRRGYRWIGLWKARGVRREAPARCACVAERSSQRISSPLRAAEHGAGAPRHQKRSWSPADRRPCISSISNNNLRAS